MKITKKNFFNLICMLIVFLSLLSYEIHLYKYYSYFQITILSLIILLFMLVSKFENDLIINLKKLVRKNIFIILMFFLMIFNTLMSNYNLYSSFSSVINVIGMALASIVLFYIIPLLDKKYGNIKKNIYNCYNFFCLFLIIIGIIIYIKKSFLGYTLIYGRAASIFYDSNFLAMILAINVIILFFSKQKNNIFKIVCIILSLMLIVFTGSRGTLLGILIAFMAYFFCFSKIKLLKKIFASVFVIAITLISLNYLNKINFFRFDQGSNGRAEMIEYAFNMFKKSPIFGYGYSNIATYLKSAGFSNASTHNSFVDFLFSFGIIPTILFAYLILKNFILAIKDTEHRELIVALTFMIFNMNTILYSFGGVGISSLIFTLTLGFISINKEAI